MTLLSILAQAGPDVPPDTMISGNWVIVLVSTLLAGLGGWAKGKGGRVSPLPLPVELKEKFLTREEHNVFAAEVRGDLKVVRQLFDRTMEKIDERSRQCDERVEKLAERMVLRDEKVATDAYNGRQRIWQKVNELAEDHSALRAQHNQRHPAGGCPK